MSLDRFHRRLAILMAGAGLLAFAGGAGFTPVSGALGVLGLILAFFWEPGPSTGRWLDRVWSPLAVLLVARALYHALVVRDDVVVPVVDLLLVLLVAESLRPRDARNEPRIYALAFALILAATAYRPGILFALAFVSFVTVGTLSMTVGHLRRQAEVRPGPEAPLTRGVVLGSLAVSGFTLLVAGVVFLTFPRVSRGWAARVSPPAVSVAGFGDEVSLGGHGARIYPNPQIVLRVEFPQGEGPDPGSLYWRGRSFDRFDGTRWIRTPGMPPSTGNSAWYMTRWGGRTLDYRVYGSRLDSRVLFSIHPLLDVDAESNIYAFLDAVGDVAFGGPDQPTYRARSVVSRPEAEALRAVDRGWSPGQGRYLQLPGDLAPEVAALADSLTAGADNDYDRIQAIQRWFREEFTYTRELPATSREASLEHFLLRRRAGHCEYFSTALAVLLRTQGIAAREVNGFLGGQWSQFGNYLAVTQNEAHAWVEVWFGGYGWVPFDPTPPGSTLAATGQAWFWPGRILFDGLQHRWNKWILDYSSDDQTSLLRRFTEPRGGTGGGGTGGLTDRLLDLLQSPVGILLGAGLAFGAVLLVLRGPGRGRIPPESRTYLKLRRLYERRFPELTLLPPAGFARALVRDGYPAGDLGARMVHDYLRIRFGPESPPGAKPQAGGPRRDEAIRTVRRALARTS